MTYDGHDAAKASELDIKPLNSISRDETMAFDKTLDQV
jgi:hypothetical protein